MASERTTPTEWSRVGPLGAFYECPRWRAGCWWLSDFYADEVVSVGVGGDRTVEARVSALK